MNFLSVAVEQPVCAVVNELTLVATMHHSSSHRSDEPSCVPGHCLLCLRRTSWVADDAECCPSAFEAKGMNDAKPGYIIDMESELKSTEAQLAELDARRVELDATAARLRQALGALTESPPRQGRKRKAPGGPSLTLEDVATALREEQTAHPGLSAEAQREAVKTRLRALDKPLHGWAMLYSRALKAADGVHARLGENRDMHPVQSRTTTSLAVGDAVRKPSA